MMKKTRQNHISGAIRPESIAIVGASASPEKVGYQILDNLIVSGYSGKIFPVNPKADKILTKKVYSSLKAIRSNIDLVVIAIPRDFVLDAVKEAIEKGASMICVITAGFAEFDAEGKKIQKEIVSLCRDANVHLLGPNCLGFINNNANINVTFSKGTPVNGPISFISQSGALISSVIDWSKQTKMGFSKIFSLGNKAMLGEVELLEMLYRDPSTEVVLGYFESFDITNELTKVLEKYSKTKPTIFLLGGKSSIGATAAKSHTGSIVTPYLTLKTYLDHIGVIVASNIEELFLFAKIFSKNSRIAGDKIAIVSNAGGPAVAATDSLAQNNLNLATLDTKTSKTLSQILQNASSFKNPVDLLGDASENAYAQAVDAVIEDENVDAVIVLATPQSNTPIKEIATNLAAKKFNKPVFASFIGGETVSVVPEILDKSRVANFDYPEDAIRSIRALLDFSTHSHAEISLAKIAERKFSESGKFDALKRHNLPVVEYMNIKSESELLGAITKVGFPLVMKTANPEVIHKMDGGGVILDIKSIEEAKNAFQRIGSPAIIGKMVKMVHEVFLGLKKDANGNILTAFGTGGIYAEVYQDLAYRVNLRNSDDVISLIRSTAMGKILDGARNQKKFNLDQLAEIVLRSNQLIADYSNISEIDFNPLIAADDGYYIVDARIICEE